MRARSWLRRTLIVLLVGGAAVATFATERPLESSSLELASVASASENGLRVEGTLEISDALRVGRVDVGVAFRAEPASGTSADPMRLATPPARASTPLTRDDWTLSFELVQGTDASGVFEADLTFDGEPAGVIVVAGTSRGASALLVFDVGPALPSSSAYVLRVRPSEGTIHGVSYEIASEPSGRLVWRGRGALADEDNPPLAARAGEPIHVAWTNEDAIPHDLIILGANGSAAVGPTPIAETVGARTVLDWEAPAQGDYVYACRIHRSSMWGTIEVR